MATLLRRGLQRLGSTSHPIRALHESQVVSQTELVTKPLTTSNDLDIKDPLKFPDYFGVRKLFTLKQLFAARVHMGHKVGTLHPGMKPFLFGTRLDHCIFDLNQTVEQLLAALNFTAHIAYRGGVIIFISHYPQHTLLVEKTAKEAGEYAHAREWKLNIFTNSENWYGAVTRLPDLCIFFSTLNSLNEEHVGIKDAAKMCIPSVAITDSNSNPNLVTFPVPGNDDSPVAIQLYCNLFKEAILLGKKERLKTMGS
uniref:Small ribosomal subunit protein uS2m n=1 Tax=Lynceus sp. MCZ IZ 141354 TaxID=1930659 RepID=A0A9N6WRG3_9CRUS|nr:EOG090X0B5N [Lynceus sp. MCZ IZ 141354]